MALSKSLADALKMGLTAVSSCPEALVRSYASCAFLICLHPLHDAGNVFMGELRRVGVKVPDSIGKLSVRNDAAFLITVVGTTSVVAVAAGFLPGDWVRFIWEAAWSRPSTLHSTELSLSLAAGLLCALPDRRHQYSYLGDWIYSTRIPSILH